MEGSQGAKPSSNSIFKGSGLPQKEEKQWACWGESENSRPLSPQWGLQETRWNEFSRISHCMSCLPFYCTKHKVNSLNSCILFILLQEDSSSGPATPAELPSPGFLRSPSPFHIYYSASHKVLVELFVAKYPSFIISSVTKTHVSDNVSCTVVPLVLCVGFSYC